MLITRDLPLISRESYLNVFDFPVSGYYQKIGFGFSKEPFTATGSDQILFQDLPAAMASLLIKIQKVISSPVLLEGIQHWGLDSADTGVRYLAPNHLAPSPPIPAILAWKKRFSSSKISAIQMEPGCWNFTP